MPGPFVRMPAGWVVGALEVFGFPLTQLSPRERDDPRRRYGPIWDRLPAWAMVCLPPPGGGDGLVDALTTIGRGFWGWIGRWWGREERSLTVRHRFRLVVAAPDPPTLRARLESVAGQLRRAGLDVRPIVGAPLQRLVRSIDWTDRHRPPDQGLEQTVTTARRPAGPSGPAEAARALPPAAERPRLPAGPR